MIMTAYQLMSPAYAASFEESRVGTNLAIRSIQLIPSKSSGQNVMLPMIISTIYLSMIVHKGILRGPENA